MAFFDTFVTPRSKVIGAKGKNSLVDIASDPDIVYRSEKQQEYARKMAEELLKRKPDIKHWTQGAAYLLDTLAGIKYQNTAGEQEVKAAYSGSDVGNNGGDNGAAQPNVTTNSIPPVKNETVPPDVQNQLEALKGPTPGSEQAPMQVPPGISLGNLPEGMTIPDQGPKGFTEKEIKDKQPVTRAASEKGSWNKRNDLPFNGVPASVRYNNPGASWSRPEDDKFGVEGYGILRSKDRNGRVQENRIGRFPTVEQGLASNMDLMSKSRFYTGQTLAKATRTWRGGNVGSNMVPRFELSDGTQIGPNTVITPELTQNKEFMTKMFGHFAEHEAGKGKSKLTPDQIAKAFDIYQAGGIDAYNKANARPDALTEARLAVNKAMPLGPQIGQNLPETGMLPEGYVPDYVDPNAPPPSIASAFQDPRVAQQRVAIPPDMQADIQSQRVADAGKPPASANIPGQPPVAPLTVNPEDIANPPPQLVDPNRARNTTPYSGPGATIDGPAPNPNDPLANRMSLGGPKPGEAADEQERKIVLAQAQTGAQPGMRQPPTAAPVGGAQPAVTQAPIAPLPGMTREDVARLRLGGMSAGEAEKMYRESHEPKRKELDRPNVEVKPGNAQQGPQYQVNMPPLGPTVDNIPTIGRVGRDNGYSYEMPLDRIPGMRPGSNGVGFAPPGSEPPAQAPAAPAAPEKTGMQKMGEFKQDLATNKARAANVELQAKNGQELANEYIKRGANAQGKIRDLDAIQAINNKYGDLIPSGPAVNWELSAKQVVGRVLGLSDKELESIAPAELKQKMLAKLATVEEDTLGGRGSNLRLSMIEQANPNMATSIKGSNLIAQVVKEQAKIDEKFAKYIENSPPSARERIVTERAEFMKEHPLKIKLGKDTVYIGNFDDMSKEELLKVLPKDAPDTFMVAAPNGKLVRMKK